jgi:hypothetical protein
LICKDENIKLVTKAMRDYLNNEIRVKWNITFHLYKFS